MSSERINAAMALVEEADSLSEMTPAQKQAWRSGQKQFWGKAKAHAKPTKHYQQVMAALRGKAKIDKGKSDTEAVYAYVVGLSGVKRAVDAIASALGKKPSGDYPPKAPVKGSENQVNIGDWDVSVSYGYTYSMDTDKMAKKGSEPVYLLEIFIE